MAEEAQTQTQAQTEVLTDWRRQLDASTSPYDARVALGVNYKEDGSDLPGGPYQLLDGDLTSLAEAETNDAIYYRSADDTWAPVTLGPGLKLEGGTLSGGGFSPGDAKLTFKATADDGWVIVNDGSIGNTVSGASTRANEDTQALFVVLFGSISDEYAPLFTSTGLERSRSSYSDGANCFNSNVQMFLPKMVGRMLTGNAGQLGQWDTSVASGSALGRIFLNVMLKL